MRNTKKENNLQDLSINDKIRKASFVPVEPQQTTRFKYLSNLFSSKKFRDRFNSIKRKVNSVVQAIGLWVRKVDWVKVRGDSFSFIVEAFIEGLSANFITHYLFGVKFNIPMIFAHGMLIKHLLSLYWRFRNNGPNPKLPSKDESAK